jgi:signal transduction histidine kinase
MLKSLYAKLALVLVLLLTTLGFGYALFSLYAGQLFLQEVNQRLNRDLARQLLVQQGFTGDEPLQAESISQLFAYYMHINPAIEIYLLDRDGTILAFEAPQMKVKRKRVALEPIERFLSGRIAYPLLGDDPRSEDGEKIFSAAAYPSSGEAEQYLYVVLGGEDYDTTKALLEDSYFLRISLTAVAATAVFGLLVGLFLFNLLTRRLDHLAQLMTRFRRSGFRDHQHYRGTNRPALRDEIDALGESYNAMAVKIREQMEALEAKDALRRNLVANVSHDLRTPLASLQGYLETLLLKSAELPLEQRRHYLGIAHQQSERLGKLISDLFDLSKLDARENPPECEAIAPGELAMDVVQKFRLQAAERAVKLDALIPVELPFIVADIALLERVLVNLVQNALDHTPDGGEIRIELAAGAEGVDMAVCNSGPAIAAGDIPHLFERFYQAPERRSGGAGLGLAIVKRILELHGSEIRVESGAETCFRFALQRWNAPGR